MDILLVVIGTFVLCFGLDKLFSNMFRSKAQHKSGRAVRLSKRYASFGLILTAVGIAALIFGVMDSIPLLVGSVVVMLVGIGLTVYYMTFGIFYDGDGFIVTTFGKKSTTYDYKDIKGQQLYILQGGGIVVELHMTDGRAVQIQSAMDGAVAFLDYAYELWVAQTGRATEDCAFHDTANSCWFPSIDTEG